jgi:carbon storage regulator
MLILSRKKNEKIRIGKDIVIQILSFSDTQVKLGIDAPTNIKILRDEIFENTENYNLEESIHKNVKSKKIYEKFDENNLTEGSDEDKE